MGFFSKIKKAIMASTATKLATGVVVLAVLGGGAAGLVYANSLTSAEKAIERATQAMKEAASPGYEEIFGLDTLFAAMEKQGTEFGLEFEIKEISAADFGLADLTIPDVGVKLMTRTDGKEKSNVNIDLQVADVTLLSGKLYVDNESIQAAVPQLFDEVMVVNYGSKSFKEDVQDSYLVELAGISKEELQKVMNLLPEEIDYVEFIKKHADKAVELAGVWYALEEGTTYEKAGKQEITIGTETVNCKVYTIEVEKEAVAKALEVVLPLVEDSVKEALDGWGERTAMLPETLEIFADGYIEFYKEIGDVHITTYVYNGRVAKQDVNFTVSGETGTVSLLYAIEGNPYENMELSLVLPIPEQEPLKAVYSATAEHTEETYSVLHKLTVNEVEACLTFDYEKLAGEFVLAAELGSYSLEVAGAVGELEKGKKLGLELDEYVFTSPDYSEEQELNAAIYLQVPETNVEPLKGDQKEVLAMTEAEFIALEQEITRNVYKLAFSLLGLGQ